MSLFIIPSQSVFGKSFAKPLAKAFRKTSNVSNSRSKILWEIVASQHWSHTVPTTTDLN